MSFFDHLENTLICDAPDSSESMTGRLETAEAALA
jgi:hypothetical protein